MSEVLLRPLGFCESFITQQSSGLWREGELSLFVTEAWVGVGGCEGKDAPPSWSPSKKHVSTWIALSVTDGGNELCPWIFCPIITCIVKSSRSVYPLSHMISHCKRVCVQHNREIVLLSEGMKEQKLVIRVCVCNGPLLYFSTGSSH